MYATKVLSRVVEGTLEIIKKEILEVDISIDDLIAIVEEIADPECAFSSYGVGEDFEGDIVFLNVGVFLEQVGYELSEDTGDDVSDEKKRVFQAIKKAGIGKEWVVDPDFKIPREGIEQCQ